MAQPNENSLLLPYYSYTKPLPVMREIVQTIEHRAKNANAQTAHSFFSKRLFQRLKKIKELFFWQRVIGYSKNIN